LEDSVLRAYRWNLRYAEALVADLCGEDAVEPGPPGLENHPAWTLGHLVTGANLLAESLGLEDDLPDGWRELFERRGPGDPRVPEADAARYPPLDALLAELRRQHERVERAWRERDAAFWAATEDWAFGRELPTNADSSIFMELTHEALHLGQLAAWRRARGLPSALLRFARESARGG
jgi:hypothetical protein